MKKLIAAAFAAVAMFGFNPANAATIIVDANANSITGGTGQSTPFSLVAGQTITISSSLNDLWNAGETPRWSDANGLIVNDRVKSVSDDAVPQTIGEVYTPGATIIGDIFGSTTQNGFTAPFGSLVGYFSTSNSYQLFGANFNGAVTGTGPLSLFYWDSNNFDNTGAIEFTINAVPEPGTWAMMLMGFGVIGLALRGRRRSAAQLA